MKKILFFFLCLTYGCSQTVPDARIIKVEPHEVEKINYSDFIKKVEYIKLNSEGGVLFGNIDKAKFYNDTFYILDSQQAIALFVFNRNGELKYKIDKKGRGPGELTSPYDFDIDEEKNELIIFDGSERKLLVFDLNHGEFKYEKRINLDLENLKVFKNKYIYLMNNTINPHDSRVIIANNNFKVINTFLPIEPGLLNYNVELPSNFSVFEDTLYLTLPSDYNIYTSTDGEKFEVMYTIDPGIYELPSEYFESGLTLMERFSKSQKSVEFISNLFKSDSFMFFSYRYEQFNGYIFINSSGEQIIHTNNLNLNDDIGLGPVSRLPLDMNENILIWQQESVILKDYLEQNERNLDGEEFEKFKKENEELIEFSKSLTRNDNPYLILTEIGL